MNIKKIIFLFLSVLITYTTLHCDDGFSSADDYFDMEFSSIVDDGNISSSIEMRGNGRVQNNSTPQMNYAFNAIEVLDDDSRANTPINLDRREPSFVDNDGFVTQDFSSDSDSINLFTIPSKMRGRGSASRGPSPAA